MVALARRPHRREPRRQCAAGSAATLFFGRRGAIVALVAVVLMVAVSGVLVVQGAVPPMSRELWDPLDPGVWVRQTFIMTLLGVVMAATELYVVERLAHQVEVYQNLAAARTRAASRARTIRTGARTRARAARAGAARAGTVTPYRSAGQDGRRRRARLQQCAHRHRRRRRDGQAPPRLSPTKSTSV